MTPLTNRRLGVFVALVLVILVAIWGGIQIAKSGSDSQAAREPGKGAATPSPEQGGGSRVPTKAAPRTSGGKDPESGSSEDLDRHFSALAAARSPGEARELLEGLRALLDAMSPDAAATVISGFLRSGRDAALSLPFKIGPGGFLETPSTFRVALLDQLGRLNPEAAAALGKEILSKPTSADEWALALRNVARHESTDESDKYLRRKTEELITNEAWQAAPSVGYLNAFDVLVHTRATESTPLLSELIQRKERVDLAYAGFLTLNRLVGREPIAMLGRLMDDAALHRSRPKMTGERFAQADFRDAAQRDLVRSWLLDPARSGVELGAFAEVFPNANQMISTNLLTVEPRVTGVEIVERDRVSLEHITAWRSDPEFEVVGPHLDVAIERLSNFVRQADEGP